ncbi:UNVERIFIED_CONTAM: hypothetical protein Sangu_1271700 [Sesamum angustifolium]|uniref:Uncharacterized protein n=1 Tax=Sesamum angustifolium TaxID=2727405 RepID=A0AAW2NKC8_9LAMI
MAVERFQLCSLGSFNSCPFTAHNNSNFCKGVRKKNLGFEILITVFCGSYSGLPSSEKLIACGFGSSHGMGTKIQGNAFLRESHSVIDLDGSTSSGTRSLYHENQLLRNGQNPDSFTSPMYRNGYLGYDSERVRRTILEHESIFRNQIQELHRLYARQQELMNEIKRRELNKDDMKGEKHRSSSLFSPISPGDAKRTWNPPHSMADCLPTSGTCSKLFPSFPEDNSVPVLPRTQDIRSLRTCEPWLSKGSVFPNGTYTLGIPADIYHRNLEKRMQERFCKLQGGEIASANRNHPASYGRDAKFSLTAVQTSQCDTEALGFNLCFIRTNHPGDTSITNPRDGVSDGLTLSRGEVTPNTCSNFNLMTRDFFQNSLDGMNGSSSRSILGSRNERSEKEHLSDDHAEKKRFDKHSSVGDFGSGKSVAFPQQYWLNHEKNFQIVRWIWGCSSIGSNFVKGPYQLAESHNGKCFMNMDDMNSKPAEVLKKDPENSQKFQEVVPQHHTVLADCQSNREKIQGRVALLQGSKFWRQTLLGQLLGIGGDSAAKVKTDEDVSRNQLETKNLVLQKGLNNYISDLRHHIDLNLSLEEEDAPSAPSVPTAIVKIATTEIDLEVPAVVEFETNASSPKESKSRKMDTPQGNPGVSYEERDRIAAEAIIAILLSGKKNLVDDCVCKPPEVASSDHLKWFADTILSQSGDTSSIHVEVPLNQNGSCEEEESVPDGMDYFEFMTLKLEETKEEYYHYEPAVLNNPSDDEIGNATLSKRSRRGQSRRGDNERTSNGTYFLFGYIVTS